MIVFYGGTFAGREKILYFCAKYTNVGVLYTCGMSVSSDTQVEVYETSDNVAIDVCNIRVAEYVK